VCYAPPVGTGPRNKGGELLEPQASRPLKDITLGPPHHLLRTGVG